jgi:hypothetical protein
MSRGREIQNQLPDGPEQERRDKALAAGSAQANSLPLWRRRRGGAGEFVVPARSSKQPSTAQAAKGATEASQSLPAKDFTASHDSKA